MILVVLPEGGCWWTLSTLWKYGGDKSQTEQRVGETREETVEDGKTTDLPAVRELYAQRLSLIVGNTNDPKCLGFHSVKLRKVRGRSTSP